MQRPDQHRGQVGWSAKQRELVAAHLPGLLGAAAVHTGSQRRGETLVEATLRAAARDVFDEDDPCSWLHAHLWARLSPGSDEASPGPGAPEVDQRAARHHRGTLHEGTLHDAVAALPPDARAAVHLVDVEGLSYEQLARVLRISAAQAAAVLHDARRQLVPVVTTAPAGRAGAAS
jgi:DNA-directed RNA polymerase specialized sigma24 family protein